MVLELLLFVSVYMLLVWLLFMNVYILVILLLLMNELVHSANLTTFHKRVQGILLLLIPECLIHISATFCKILLNIDYMIGYWRYLRHYMTFFFSIIIHFMI